MTVASINFWAFCDVHPVLGTLYFFAALAAVCVCTESLAQSIWKAK